MNHQDIVTRRNELDDKESEIQLGQIAVIEAERKSLQELCGGMGHVFGAPPMGKRRIDDKRMCVFCEAVEP